MNKYLMEMVRDEIKKTKAKNIAEGYEIGQLHMLQDIMMGINKMSNPTVKGIIEVLDNKLNELKEGE